MEKRTLLAVAICMGILLVWWKVFPPAPPAPPPPPAPGAAASAPVTPGGAASAGTPAPSAGGATAPTPGAPAGGAAAARAPEELVTLDTPVARYVLSSWGGNLREVKLKQRQFLHDRKDPESGYRIVAAKTPETAPLRLSFPKTGFSSPPALDGAWTVSRPAPDAVVFRTESAEAAVEKRFRLDGDFRLHLEVTVENRSDKPVDESLAMHLYGVQDPAKLGSGFWDVASSNVATAICFVNDKLHRENFDSLSKESKEFAGTVSWVAADDKYFLVAAIPHPDDRSGQRVCGLRGRDHYNGEAWLSLPVRTLPAGGKLTHTFTVFAGPKYRDLLEQVKPANQDIELGKAVDLNFAVLAAPLLWLLKLFHGWVGNWGIAIIMLTLFVKLLTFYPTHRAMMSGKRMQRLTPKMQALRKKYENDRQRLGVETMNLYKQEGVSPFGGCLPTLITMPIWIALFSTLNYAVELHGTPFFGYIHDLSARDPYFITPLIMGGIMFLQMRMSPAGADPQQQKVMAIMMPVMFTLFSLFLPAGLAIYTLTNSLLAILHQMFINRWDKKMTAAAGGKG
jgi:YidC/Oxa1 family membrane protein insertase